MKRSLVTVLAAVVCITGAIMVLQTSEPGAQLATFAPKVRSDREVSIDAVPQAVRSTILREAAGNEISEVEEVTTETGRYFEADWMDNGREVEIQVSPTGELLERGFGDDDGDSPDDDETDDKDADVKDADVKDDADTSE